MALAFVARAGASSKTVTVEYRYFTGLATMTGNWSALKAASDGKVYVGLACNGCDGHLVFYDSKKDRMVDVGNVTRLAGENGLDLGPQSKIHTKFGEGRTAASILRPTRKSGSTMHALAPRRDTLALITWPTIPRPGRCRTSVSAPGSKG